MSSSTFSGNSAIYGGGGIFNGGGAAPLTVSNSIIADSTSGGDCVGTVSSASVNNLIKDTGTNACGLANGANGNIIGSDPLLSPLANNGGLTQTMALQAGSPAIRAIRRPARPLTSAAMPVSVSAISVRMSMCRHR